MRATYPEHLIVYLITLIIFADEVIIIIIIIPATVAMWRDCL
jgi:hypothetical protein